MGNFLRRLCLPNAVRHWSLRSVQVKLIKMGAVTFDETVIIAPGASHSWDVREYDSCEYSFFVRQHDIGFEGNATPRKRARSPGRVSRWTTATAC